MADFLDRLAEKGNKSTSSGGGDLLDRISSKKEPETSFGQKALQFGIGAGKDILKQASELGNIASFGSGRYFETEEEAKKRKEFYRPKTSAERAGGTTAEIGTMLAPIPGLSEVEVAKSAPLLLRMLVPEGKAALDVGIKTLAQTGSPKEAAEAGIAGGAVGGLTQLAVPGLSRLLNRAAKSQYAKVLHPLGRKAKEVAEEHIPDIVEQGYKGAAAPSLEALAGKFQSQVDTLGKQISDAYQKLDQTQRTRLGPVYDDLAKWVETNAFTPKGAIKDPQILQAGLERMKYLQDTLGPYIGNASPSEVWNVRQALDKYVYRNKLTADESVAAGKQVTRALGDAIRNQLNKQHPEIGDLNNRFHMWRSAAELMDRNITNELGKLNFARNSGIIGRFLMGAAVGGGTEIAGRRGEINPWETASAAALAGLAFESTGWRTVSAVTKAKIADLLMRGEGKAAAALAARATGVLRGQVDRRMNKGDEE